MDKTYINPLVIHQRDQQPVILPEGHDGVWLDSGYRVLAVTFADMRESWEGWLASMLAQAKRREEANDGE